MNELSEMSGFEEDVGISTQQQSESSSLHLCKLKKCGHLLHRACLIMYTKNYTDAKVRKFYKTVMIGDDQ